VTAGIAAAGSSPSVTKWYRSSRIPNEPELTARVTMTALAVLSRSAPGWSTRVLTGSRMSFMSEPHQRS